MNETMSEVDVILDDSMNLIARLRVQSSTVTLAQLEAAFECDGGIGSAEKGEKADALVALLKKVELHTNALWQTTTACTSSEGADALVNQVIDRFEAGLLRLRAQFSAAIDFEIKVESYADERPEWLVFKSGTLKRLSDLGVSLSVAYC